MPKGYPINPEKASLLRSIAQKKRIRTPEWHEKVRIILIKRNKSKYDKKRIHLNKNKKWKSIVSNYTCGCDWKQYA